MFKRIYEYLTFSDINKRYKLPEINNLSGSDLKIHLENYWSEVEDRVRCMVRWIMIIFLSILLIYLIFVK